MNSSQMLGAQLGGKKGYHQLLINDERILLRPKPGIFILAIVFLLSGGLCFGLQYGAWVFDREVYVTAAILLWVLAFGMTLLWVVLGRSMRMKVNLKSGEVTIKGSHYHQNLELKVDELDGVFLMKELVPEERSGIKDGVYAYLLGLRVSKVALSRWQAERAQAIALLFHEEDEVLRDYGQQLSEAMGKPFEYFDKTAELP